MGKSRYAPIIGGVLVLHGLLLWGLNSGLLQRTVEVFVPVVAISEMVEQPKVRPPEPPPPPPKPQEHIKPPPVAAAPVPVTPATPVAPTLPQTVADAPPLPTAVTGTAAPQPAAPRTPPATTAIAPAAVAQKADPISEADYLHNPKPVYPPLSKRRGEQGRVVVHVLFGADGTAQKVEVKTSSGFERLDKAALETLMSWRKRVPEPKWFEVPINFVLE